MKKGNRISLTASALALTILASVTGCESHPKTVEAHAGGRSMVFDSPRLRQLNQGVEAAEAQPWYASRNDARLTTNAGYMTPTYEAEGTYTYDRQYTNGGHVRDYYNTTSYRATRTEAVR